MKTTYKGRTTEQSNLLFEPVKTYINKPKKSNKFGAPSLYYDGIYYFPKDIKENQRENTSFEIQGVFFQGKWKQDTFYITEDFKNFLESNL